MLDLSVIDLNEVVKTSDQGGKGRQVLWQDSESIAFLSRGRKQRLDFHVDPSDEVTLELRGEQHLHYITPEGDHKVAIIRAGQMVLCPAGVPHSPRVSDDAWFIVFERKREPEEQDRFMWFCDQCGEKVYEVAVHVGDYRQDPVSQVHKQFYGNESLRTCKRCGTIIAQPNP